MSEFKTVTITMSRELAERLDCRRNLKVALDAMNELREVLAVSDMADRIKSAACTECASHPCICAAIAAPVVERQPDVWRYSDKFGVSPWFDGAPDEINTQFVEGRKGVIERAYTSPPAPIVGPEFLAEFENVLLLFAPYDQSNMQVLINARACLDKVKRWMK